jgi:peptide/nickel transport system permease protein
MTANTKAAVLDAEGISTIKEESPGAVVFRRFRRHRLAMVALFVIAFIFFVSFFAQALAPFEPDAVDVNNRFATPGTVDAATGNTHFLGTDNIGRDYFSRLLFAGRISLTVAVLAVVIAELIGVTVGAISGFYGGIVDTLIMRFVEFMLTIPTLPLLLIISSMLMRNPDLIPFPDALLNILGRIMLLRPSDVRQALIIVMILAGFGWLGSAQIMRGMVLALREQTFVEAARSLGASNGRIIFLHMIPNAMAPIIVSASLGLAGYIITEASLSFLGFGIQDPIPTWGNMLSATQGFMTDRPWLPLIPGLPIFLSALCFNYIGDGLRDALDPRLKM